MTKIDPVEIMARAVWGTVPKIDYKEFEDLPDGSQRAVKMEMQAAIAALEAAGFRLVRKDEVTEEMLRAGHRAHTGDRGIGFYFDTSDIIQAAIESAPLWSEK